MCMYVNYGPLNMGIFFTAFDTGIYKKNKVYAQKGIDKITNTIISKINNAKHKFQYK